MNHKKAMSSVITYGVLVLITIICLFPIVWMCLISIKDTSESITGFNSILVTHPTLGNFKRLFEMIPVGQNTFNSVFTTIMGTVTSLFFCALAGFAFAKYKFPGKTVLFYFVIATMLVPPEVGSVPLFIIMKKVGLINSLWSLIIPRIATAVGIFYMNQYITDVPDEIKEQVGVLPQQAQSSQAELQQDGTGEAASDATAQGTEQTPAFSDDMLRMISQEVVQENADMILSEDANADLGVINETIFENLKRMMSQSGGTVSQEDMESLIGEVISRNTSETPSVEESNVFTRRTGSSCSTAGDTRNRGSICCRTC